ncbi:sigma factor PP2C phosphatase [Desulforamulus profundi]|uniref:Sigma factor PP2C phosphatase n=1 Tax=Desulforamulus profundi TaxID=1383067 RepID=A0A2C6ME95_9FIRM|nr:phosphatase [Desulforamulus profundi]PHJ37924.1 sigma factor PP2C phosphatase [Desulforamulus profundi]
MMKKHLCLLIGPAKYPEDDERMVSMFLAEPGKKIICGSSTANMVSRFLPDTQTLSDVTGLVLVTDGTLILSQTLDILLNYGHLEALPGGQEDANLLVAALSEAESISFLIGMAANKSQRSLSLPAKPIVKSRFARELVDFLKKKGKQVMVEYF